MIFERDEYSVSYTPGSDVATLSGVMRLATPAAYERVFIALATRIGTGEPLAVDLTKLTFMNSSGIRALAMLVLAAKERGTALRLVANGAVPWQKKTASSLAAVSRDLAVELR
ncbi:MAG: STAS domain-containing protein [Gemmatimonadales bacterium]